MKLRHIPNLITAARIVLVGPVVWYLLQDAYGPALLLFVIAGASDGLDGYLAKRFNWSSYIGAFLDPLADKLLLVASVSVLVWNGVLPIWLFALVVLRDVVIIVGAFLYRFLFGPFEAKPTFLSKVNTTVQIALVFVALLAQIEPEIVGTLYQWLIWITFVTTVSSGVDYVMTWSKKARIEAKQKRTHKE